MRHPNPARSRTEPRMPPSTGPANARSGRLETLLEVGRQLSRIQDLESLLGGVAAACGQLLDSDSVGIRMIDGDDLVVVGSAGTGREEMPTPRIRIGESLIGTVAATGRPLVVSDPANDPRLAPAHRDAYRRGGYRGFLGVPLTQGDQVLGVLSIRTRRAEGFSPEDLSIAAAFAAQASIALENARLYRQAEDRADKLKTLSAVTRLMTSAPDASQVFDAVARAATTLLDATAARVWIADPGARQLRTQGRYEPDPSLARLLADVSTIAYGEGPVGRVAESGRVEHVRDIRTDPRWLNRRLATDANLRSFIGLPLGVDGRVVGVLSVLFRQERCIGDEDRELMTMLADQAAIAIRNAWLMEGLRTRQTGLEALLDVGRQLSQIQPLPTLLDAIAAACGRVLASESVGLRLVEGDDLVLAGSWGDAREVMLSARLRIGESLSGQVAVTGEALMVTDLANDARVIPEHRDAIRRRGYSALLAVPVKMGRRVVGVLSVRTKRPAGFSDEDLSIATAFASQAAVALENSRLYQETDRAYQELSQAQEQLTQARKMEAVGRLAGGVAHDFNNLLMVIMGRSELLLQQFEANDPKRGATELIRDTTKRAADLTRQLLAFGRKQVLQPRVLDLNTAVDNMSELLRRVIGEDIVLGAALDPHLGRVKADPTQLEQVIMNLAINARDAMPEGGRLTIETANVDLDGGYAQRHLEVDPGPYVMLALTDTGIGMDEATQARIFEPFFTTKEPGKGTGLGLATVYGIIRQSGGSVWVYSEPGRGTTFKIYLPRVAEPVEATVRRPSVQTVAGGLETVLIAEDDPAVREVVSAVLSQKGYRLLRAPDGQTALELAQAQPGEIQLLVTDLVMPGMTGRELAEALAAARPGLKVLYMSGYTDDAVVRHGVLEAGMPYLQKPFAPEALARKVRELLDRP